MYGFDGRFTEGIDIRDQCGDVVFDTSIRHNDCQEKVR